MECAFTLLKSSFHITPLFTEKLHVLHADFDKSLLGSKWLLDTKCHLIQHYSLLVCISNTLKLAALERENFTNKAKSDFKVSSTKDCTGRWLKTFCSIHFQISRENHFGILLYWFLAFIVSKSADFNIILKLSSLNWACFHQYTYWKFLV